MIRFATAFTLLCLFSGAPLVNAAPIQLDSFTGSPGTFVGSGPALQTNVPTNTSPYFADRSLSVSHVLGFGDAVQVQSGLLQTASFNNGFATTLSYKNFGSIALDSIGSFNFDFIFVDLPFIGNILLTDASNTTSTANFNVPASAMNALNMVSVPISGFAGAANLSQITGIQFVFNTGGTDAVDFTLRASGTNIPVLAPGDPVPEPSTYATFGFLALMGGYAARRKLMAAAVATA